MKEEEPLYVGVIDSVDLRKDLLNSSRILISSLKKYEMSRLLKEEKEAEFIELRKVVKEIHILNNRLKTVMPRASIRAKPKAAEKEEKEMPRIMRLAQPKIIEEKTRLAELEDELANVEEKLQKME